MDILSDRRALWLSRAVLPHERGLRVWLQRRTSLSPHDIDDVVQETYAILASLGSVEHIRDPRSYMFQTAKSILLQQVRKAQVVSFERVSELEYLIVEDDGPTPEDINSDRQELNRLVKAISRFPARCREAFYLCKFEGLSQREAAFRLGISENTVKKHVAKGIHLLMDLSKRIDNAEDASRYPERVGQAEEVDDAARDQHRD
ncbi:RNA polymerase sigma factor [Pseudoxanthomonas putridarboris]|uniref:RNA polymerase sigma factor n=1 Tax=Pseudoxanthomonas putridarboris TaxID=752605 RepID=A0ABU9J340_9GAMM